MSQEVERVYTINLGKVLLSVDTHRAPRAINMIKEFARHHMKTADVRIEEDLAHQIWSRGVRSPPRKVRVRMSKTDEGYVLISPYTDDIVAEVSDKKGKKNAPDKKGKKDSPDKKGKKNAPDKKGKKETPTKEVKVEPTKEVKVEPTKDVKVEPTKDVKLTPSPKAAPSKAIKKDIPTKK